MKFIFNLQRFVAGAAMSESVNDAYGNIWNTENLGMGQQVISTKNKNTNKNLKCYVGYDGVYITVGDYTKTITKAIYDKLYTDVYLFMNSTACTTFWKNQDLIEHIIQDNLGLPFSLVTIKPKNFTLPDVITSTYTARDNTYYIRSFCILSESSNVVNYVAN